MLGAKIQATAMAEQQIPPGFRFYPTEEELLSFYLRNQLEGRCHEIHSAIPVLDIYNIEPWNLPESSGQLCQGDSEQWFFFVPRQEREARGGRPSRTTACGYWKATGSPGYVYSSDNRVIGVKKTMVFYSGKAPTGRKTKWKMNEYRAIEQETTPFTSTPIPKLRHEFCVCRIYVTSGSFRAFDRRPLQVKTGNVVSADSFCEERAMGDGRTSEFLLSSPRVDREDSAWTMHHGDSQNPPWDSEKQIEMNT